MQVRLRVAGLLAGRRRASAPRGHGHRRRAVASAASRPPDADRPASAAGRGLRLRFSSSCRAGCRPVCSSSGRGPRWNPICDCRAPIAINLNVLALVALFTGALLVFSTQALSVVRRRAELALLRVLGMTRRRLVRLLAIESALVGVIGALLGLALGHLLAAGIVGAVGADLGAGFFAGVRPRLQVDLARAGAVLRGRCDRGAGGWPAARDRGGARAAGPRTEGRRRAGRLSRASSRPGWDCC